MLAGLTCLNPVLIQEQQYLVASQAARTGGLSWEAKRQPEKGLMNQAKGALEMAREGGRGSGAVVAAWGSGRRVRLPCWAGGGLEGERGSHSECGQSPS